MELVARFERPPAVPARGLANRLYSVGALCRLTETQKGAVKLQGPCMIALDAVQPGEERPGRGLQDGSAGGGGASTTWSLRQCAGR